MATGFRDVTFKILTPDGVLPSPVADEQGWMRYTATIRVASTADVSRLRESMSTITEKPAMGMRGGGGVIVEAGIGARTLTIPLPAGVEAAYDAILVAWEPFAQLLVDTHWSGEAMWLLLAAQ